MIVPNMRKLIIQHLPKRSVMTAREIQHWWGQTSCHHVGDGSFWPIDLGTLSSYLNAYVKAKKLRKVPNVGPRGGNGYFKP